MSRVLSAGFCVVVGLYWLAVGSGSAGGGGFRLLVGIFTCFWLGAAVYPLIARRVRLGWASSTLLVVALGLAAFAAAGPLLLNEWIRADSDRYIWIISHVHPCSAMGGGPGMVWVFGTSWLAAIGAVTYAATFRVTVPHVVAGLGLGALLLAATAAAMFPDPAIFARALGCI